MGSNKLVFSCIIGILLGFLVPVIFPWDRYVTLMIGLIGGLFGIRRFGLGDGFVGRGLRFFGRFQFGVGVLIVR